MSHNLEQLFESNKRWADSITEEIPDFFEKLAAQQNPEYLWVGCADSRVPANEIVGLLPGELFVHRNVANVVVHSDLNFLAVLQYAVEVLKVEHILVCGHYGCGGVRAAMESKELGLIDNWLRHIRDVYHRHLGELSQIDDLCQRADRLCELNVLEQVNNVCTTSIVQRAWRNDQSLSVHAVIYGIADGRLRALQPSVTGLDGVSEAYRVE